MASKPKALLIEDFFRSVHRIFGLEEEVVRTVLRNNNCKNFVAGEWNMYFDLIRKHIREEEAKSWFPDGCPVCGSAIVRVLDRDSKFGEKYGWNCVVEDRHYFDHLTNKLVKSHKEGEERRKSLEIVVLADTWKYIANQEQQAEMEVHAEDDRRYRVKNALPFIQ